MEIMRWVMKTSQRKSRRHWGDSLYLENRGDHEGCRHPNPENCLVSRENRGPRFSFSMLAFVKADEAG